MTGNRLDSCLKDVREQAEILYDSITVSRHEWTLWKKEIEGEVGKLAGYAAADRKLTNDLVIVAELTGSKT